MLVDESEVVELRVVGLGVVVVVDVVVVEVSHQGAGFVALGAAVVTGLVTYPLPHLLQKP